jgi:CheY-like chemotaxis protein
MMNTRFSVLVVDDNPIVRSTAVHLFQDLGFQVHDAYSGEGALALIRKHPRVGLLFVDVRMPGMDGFALAEAAQSMRPGIKVVFTSGYVDARSVPDEALFIAKPWRVDEIATALEIACAA